MDRPFPLLLDRIQSTFIDVLFILLLMFGIAAILDRFDHVPDWVRMAIFIGLWAIYEPVATAFGCTLGNYVKGIRVRQHDNYESRINIFQAFIRYLIKTTLGWISFVTINMNPDKRAIHDFASGSVMIKVNRFLHVAESIPDLQ